MARINKAHLNIRGDLFQLAVLAVLKLRHHLLRILNGVHRLHHGRTCTLCLAVFPLRFHFLNVCRILQHHHAQLNAGRGAINRPAESLFVHQRNTPRMIHVGMSQQNGIHFAGSDRQRLVFIDIDPLLHAAVNQNVFPAGLQQSAAAGHFMVCAQKCQFHSNSLL